MFTTTSMPHHRKTKRPIKGELCPPKEADVTGLLIRDGDLDTIAPVIHRRRMEKLLGCGKLVIQLDHNLDINTWTRKWSSFHSLVGSVRTCGGNKGKEHEKFQIEEWFGRVMRFRNDAIIILSNICLQLPFELAYAHLYEIIGSDVVKFGLTASLASHLHDTSPGHHSAPNHIRGVGESDGEFKKTGKVSSPADLRYKEGLLFPGRLIKDAENVKVGGDLHKTIKPSRLKELNEMFRNEKILLSCGQRWTNMVLEDNATGEDALRGWLVAAYASNMEENVSKWDHLQYAYEKMKVVMRTLLPEIQARGWHTDRFLDGKGMRFGF
ncbi:hypothetical protein L2E82_10788 [Cichorium intybus]|uniref:Uncharacterized protein n=1 Tax=Cichorium intybus TaxID=13427 RepID=A0ACB9GBM6_CICIN|nr:hypothetical protein L2E82_10788 [Cichorium intybus]